MHVATTVEGATINLAGFKNITPRAVNSISKPRLNTVENLLKVNLWRSLGRSKLVAADVLTNGVPREVFDEAARDTFAKESAVFKRYNVVTMLYDIKFTNEEYVLSYNPLEDIL